jgi:hypothetical protein
MHFLSSLFDSEGAPKDSGPETRHSSIAGTHPPPIFVAVLFFRFPLGDNAPPVAANPKLSPAYLFPLLNELVFVLLGALLVFIALSRRFSLPRHSIAWMGLGVILIYWGLRIWIRSMRAQPRWPSGVRAASLALVGAIVLGIAFLPFSLAAPLDCLERLGSDPDLLGACKSGSAR